MRVRRDASRTAHLPRAAAPLTPRLPPHYRYDCVTSVLTNKAFSQHKIPYTKVDGGVVPTLKHKFFEARLRRVSDTADGAHPTDPTHTPRSSRHRPTCRSGCAPSSTSRGWSASRRRSSTA